MEQMNLGDPQLENGQGLCCVVDPKWRPSLEPDFCKCKSISIFKNNFNVNKRKKWKGKREKGKKGGREGCCNIVSSVLITILIIPSANPWPIYMLLVLCSYWVQGSTQSFAKVRRGLWLVQNNTNSVYDCASLLGGYIL